MRGIVDWCGRHRALTIVVCWIYFFWVSAAHDMVQDFAYGLRRMVGKEHWAVLVAGVCVVAGGVVCWRALHALRRPAAPRVVALAWWGSITLMVACSLTLFATNIEAIHFIQYALLAIPVYGLTRRVGATVLLIGILGALDEWYQYAFIFENWRIRWDVNDVVMNVLGALGGVSAVLVFGGARRVSPERPRFAATAIWGPFAIVLGLVAAGSGILLATGDMDLYRDEGDPYAAIQLSRESRPTERWEDPVWGRGHYVLHPGVGIALCFLLIGAFTALDHVVVLPDE